VTLDPYAPPKAKLADVVASEPTVPANVLKNIKVAWIAGTISGVITLLVTVFAIFGQSILGFTAWELFDVALIFGLAFGIYKKSRTCAILMFIYFVSAKILIMSETGKADGLLMGLLFAYFFARGIQGTFQYHRLLQAHRSAVVADA
jgi:serine/threonine-protein kinase